MVYFFIDLSNHSFIILLLEEPPYSLLRIVRTISRFKRPNFLKLRKNAENVMEN